MSSKQNATDLPAAWAAAKVIANDPPNLSRREGGPSVGLAWCGISASAVGLVGAVVIGVLVGQNYPWNLLAMYLALFIFGGGLILLLWAAPRSYINVVAVVIRRAQTIVRRGALTFSALSALAVLILVIVAHFAAWHSSWYLPVLLLAVIGTAVAFQSLTLGASMVSASSSIRGYDGRRWALLILSFGVCTIGATVGAMAARSLGSGAGAVWPSVTLAVFSVVVGIFVQQHRELDDSIGELDRALAHLHERLMTSPLDESSLRAACTTLESAFVTPVRGPFSIAPLPLIDDELRICLYYLMSVVTALPFRTTSKDEVAALDRLLARHDSRLLLAELAWEIRRRLLRPGKTVKRLDERAFQFGEYPQIAAPRSHRAGDAAL
ncbi:hypothetical protein [Leifsonia shinshuensis]